jgi:hypothetical protein
MLLLPYDVAHLPSDLQGYSPALKFHRGFVKQRTSQKELCGLFFVLDIESWHGFHLVEIITELMIYEAEIFQSWGDWSAVSQRVSSQTRIILLEQSLGGEWTCRCCIWWWWIGNPASGSAAHTPPRRARSSLIRCCTCK